MSRARYSYGDDNEQEETLDNDIIITGLRRRVESQRASKQVRRSRHGRQPSQWQAYWQDHKAEIIIILSFTCIILLMIGVSVFINFDDNSAEDTTAPPSVTVRHPVSPQSNLAPTITVKPSQPVQSPKTQLKPASKDFPKFIWKYEQVLGNDEMWNRLRINHQQFGALSGFKVVTLSSSNYKDYVRAQAASQIVKDVKAATEAGVTNVWEWIKTIIMLRVLCQNGGVLLYHPDIYLTESLDWLQSLDTNPYINLGKRAKPAQFFGFYNPKQSLQRFEKVKNTGQPLTQPFKRVETGPFLEQGFMAAVSDSPFVDALIDRLMFSLRDSSYLGSGSIPINKMKVAGNTMSENYIAATTIRILEQRSKELNTDMMGAMQDYGLALMNTFYALHKMEIQMPIKEGQKQIQYLTHLDESELTVNFGPFHYCLYLFKQTPLRTHLDRVKKGEAKVMKGSFLHRVFFAKQSPPGLYDNKEVGRVQTDFKAWQGLPKKVWVIWDSGIQNSKATNQLSVEHMRKKVNESGFDLTIVDNNNMKDYVKQETLGRIEYAIKHAKVKTFTHTRPDLLRMALVLEHGGVYMDTTYVLLENLDWLVNISKYPSQLIFNRYDSLPKIFFTFHPWYGNPAEWTVDDQANTKSAWHLAYENNFFAAEPGNEFLQAWFDQTLANLERPYSYTQAQLKQHGIFDERWTVKPEDQYLMPMESLKMTVAKKETQLKSQTNRKWSNAAEYYGIWSMSGYLGAQKYRTEFNIDTTSASMGKQGMFNYFLAEYSQEYAEGLVGQTRNFYKLYNWQNVGLDNYLKNHYDNKGNQNMALHPKSLVMKTLLADKPVINRQGTKSEVVYPDRPA